MKPLILIAAFAVILISGCTNSNEATEPEAAIKSKAEIQRERTSQFTNNFLHLDPKLLSSISVTNTADGNPNSIGVELNKEFNKLAQVQKNLVTKQIAGWWFKAVSTNRIGDSKAEVEFRDSVGKLITTYKEP